MQSEGETTLVHRPVQARASADSMKEELEDRKPLLQSAGRKSKGPFTEPEKKRVKATLDRAQLAPWKALCFCLVFILLELGKQVTSYSISYYNEGVYPMPQTAIVCATEFVKLLAMVFLATKNNIWKEMKPSLYFGVPSAVYAITNNLYFFALYYTTPPVWNVLIQFRVSGML